VNTDPESSESAEICKAIREEVVCGKCVSSTILLSKEGVLGGRPKGTTLFRGEAEYGEEKAVNYYYLIRCSFFKFNVNMPAEIVFCEGFKKRNFDEP